MYRQSVGVADADLGQHPPGEFAEGFCLRGSSEGFELLARQHGVLWRWLSIIAKDTCRTKE